MRLLHYKEWSLTSALSKCARRLARVLCISFIMHDRVPRAAEQDDEDEEPECSAPPGGEAASVACPLVCCWKHHKNKFWPSYQHIRIITTRIHFMRVVRAD